MRYFFITSAKLVLILILAGSAFAAHSQITYSPYSRFGLGTLYQEGSVANQSLGGAATPVAYPWAVNQQNPATYSLLVGPTFQFSGRASLVNLETTEASQNIRTGSINDLSFGFPLRNEWGIGFGVTPYSSTSYNISVADQNEEAGNFDRSYSGDGGITKAFLGVSKGFNIRKTTVVRDSLGQPTDTLITTPHKIYLGANFNYFFGSMQNTQRLNFEDDNFFSNRKSSSTGVNGPGANFGVYYSTDLYKKFKRKNLVRNLSLKVGASYSIESSMNAEVEALSVSYIDQSGIEYIVDTAAYSRNDNQNLNLPQKIGAGIALVYTNQDRRFLLALDFKQQDWTSLDSEVQTMNTSLLGESREYSIGFEYTPNYNFRDFNLSFHELGNYRLGFRLSDTYLRLNGEPIQEMAITAGLSLPIKSSRSLSRFHLGMDFGKRGTTENQLIEEQFMQVYIGLTLNPDFRNAWFRQRKYR